MRRIALSLLVVLGVVAQSQRAGTGSIAGKTVDLDSLFVPWPSVGLMSTGNSFPGMNKSGDKSGAFLLTGIPTGRYIFAAKVGGFREIVRPVTVEEGKETNLGPVLLPAGSCDDPGAACFASKSDAATVPVISVCEALTKRDHYFSRQVIIVGRLSEGKRETTLNADCPFAVATGAFAWPNSIAISDAAGARLPQLPGGFKWDEKALAKARNPMNGKLSAIFGRFESPAGLVTLDCPHSLNCTHGLTMLAVPPALLIQDAARTSRVLD